MVSEDCSAVETVLPRLLTVSREAARKLVVSSSLCCCCCWRLTAVWRSSTTLRMSPPPSLSSELRMSSLISSRTSRGLAWSSLRLWRRLLMSPSAVQSE